MSITQAHDFLIQWHLTDRCNLSCKHCYQEGRQASETSLAEINRGIDEVTEMLKAWREAYELEFSPSFNVTGGEPFLRSDIFIILEKMVGQGFEVNVLSNGTLVTAATAGNLKRLGVHHVQVSLEGPREIHDLMRGPGSFAAALAGIQHLLAAGVQVSLNTTLSRLNADFFLELVELAKSWGVPSIGFSRLVPSGRGLKMLAQILTAAQVKEFYEKIFSLEVDGLEISSGDPVAGQMTAGAGGDDLGDIPLGGCAAGVAGLTILPDGTVTPCRRLNIPLGNIRRDALRQIWAASPVLGWLRDRSKYQEKCRACPRWAACRGCRAIAYACSQAQGNPDFLAPDPQCFL